MNASRMAAMVIAALLLAYPLSTGPVSRWQLGHGYKDYKPLPPVLQTFYWPIAKLCQVPVCQKAAFAYLKLWLPNDAVESYGFDKPILIGI
ncbi:MAG: hypothetical protein ACAI37_05615 [Chthoniobacter sp.]